MKTKLIKLTAIIKKRESGIWKGFRYTEFYKGKELFATFPPEQKQPRRNKNTIVLNCFTWSIKKWIIKF